MLRFIVLSSLTSFCVNAQNSTSDKLSGSLVTLPNFDSPSVFQVTQPVDHSEGPIWDDRKSILYYVDIHSGRVLSYNYNTKKVNFITLKGDVTPIIPSKNNENVLIVGVNRSLVAIEWDGEKEVGNQRVLTTVSSQFPQSRFNDGKADKSGRLWIGTMGFENLETGALEPNQGILYKLTKDTLISPKVEISPVNISNGLCWNKANNKMYYIDSPTRKVVEYDYNEEKGEISNPKVVIDITKYPQITGVPDGMTIDKEDNLWVALYGGGAIIRVNPRNGQLLQVIPIPARDVTSVAWGGPQHDILFVTTSRRSLSEDLRKVYHAAGSIFAVTNLRISGFPVHYADLVDTVRRANLLAEIILNTNELFSSPPSEELTYPQSNNQQRKRTTGKAEVLLSHGTLNKTMTNTFKSPSVTQVAEPVNIGESPVWDRRVGKLYYVDIHNGKVLAYNYQNETTKVVAEYPGKDIAPIILTKNDPNILIAGINRDVVKIALCSSSTEPVVLHTVQKEKPKNRFNDGKADNRGRVWIGTMGHEETNQLLDPKAGALFKFTKENITNPSLMIPQVDISNGLTWNCEGTKFYYIDTVTEEIAEYDYNAETGNISNKKVAFSTKGKGMGYPDGMTIDEDNNLWIALYGGGSIIQINPTTATLLRRIPIPAQYTTSVAWGGPNMDILFVTTSRRWLSPNLKRLSNNLAQEVCTRLLTLGQKDSRILKRIYNLVLVFIRKQNIHRYL